MFCTWEPRLHCHILRKNNLIIRTKHRWKDFFQKIMKFLSLEIFKRKPRKHLASRLYREFRKYMKKRKKKNNQNFNSCVSWSGRSWVSSESISLEEKIEISGNFHNVPSCPEKTSAWVYRQGKPIKLKVKYWPFFLNLKEKKTSSSYIMDFYSKKSVGYNYSLAYDEIPRKSIQALMTIMGGPISIFSLWYFVNYTVPFLWMKLNHLVTLRKGNLTCWIKFYKAEKTLNSAEMSKDEIQVLVLPFTYLLVEQVNSPPRAFIFPSIKWG